MTDKLSPSDLQKADALLSELFQEVQEWEGTLAGGTQLGVGAEAVDSLFQTQVRFGNPSDRLIRLTEETFEQSGIELDEMYKQQMRDRYDFYAMTLSVNLRPARAAKFWRLTCELDFSPKGSNEAIVQRLFPTQKWRAAIDFGAKMEVGLNGDLDWNLGVDSSQLNELIEALPVELRANVGNKNEFQAGVVIPAYRYELGDSEILATGEGSSTCYWRIQDSELQKIGTAKFAIVFKVPKGTRSIILRGIVWADPDLNWLTADLRDIFGDLSDRVKQLLRQKNQVASRFARGDSEEWKLDLTQSIG